MEEYVHVKIRLHQLNICDSFELSGTVFYEEKKSLYIKLFEISLHFEVTISYRLREVLCKIKPSATSYFTLT